MVAAEAVGEGRGNGEMFKEYKASVTQDEYILDIC